jgi:hypothetical protein
VGSAVAATTPKEDFSDARTWERQCRKQARGFLAVELLLEGVTKEGLAGMKRDGSPAGHLARAMDRIFRGTLPQLTPEHEERRRQLAALAASCRAEPDVS